MSEHTPGPWAFSTSPQPNGCPIVGARGLMVAMLAHSVCYADQRETALANARLIAAAPDLLEALQMGYAETMDYIRLNNLGGEQNQWLCMARAAILKAAGDNA